MEDPMKATRSIGFKLSFFELCTIFVIIVLFLILQCPCFAATPEKSDTAPATPPVSKERLYRDVAAMTSINPPRNNKNIESLNKASGYILEEFKKTGCRTELQRFTFNGKEYTNVICSLGPEKAERIIIGAHYDVKGDQPGADDNASGVAGLLELSRLVAAGAKPPERRFDFVAYPLEERDFVHETFRTRHLGSYVHAKSLADAKVPVRAMVCLEMIGYFTEKPNSQHYPLFFLKWFYPDRGNYISVVGKLGQGGLVDQVRTAMKSAMNAPVTSIAAPPFVPGIDFSDHRSYWRFGYKAVMITDTAFYRNRNYHKKTDTIESLDFDKMTEVVKGVYRAVLGL